MVPVFPAPQPRSSSKPPTPRLNPQRELVPADEPILRVLASYHLLTAEQVTRLLYAAGSLTYAKARLKHLVDAGYAERYKQPRRTDRGNLPFIYRLSRRGVAFLREALGVEIGGRIRPARVGEYTYLRYEHLLRLNDVLISLELLCRSEPQLTLMTMLHDEVLRRTPFIVTLPDGTTARVVPDAWIDLRVHQGGVEYQECIAIELDRGTEHRAAWQAKVRALVAWVSGPYQTAFATEAIVFAVVTTAGERRVRQLVNWTADALGSLGRLDLAGQFAFIAQDATTRTPQSMFLAPVWRQSGLASPAPLLVLAEGAT